MVGLGNAFEFEIVFWKWLFYYFLPILSRNNHIIGRSILENNILTSFLGVEPNNPTGKQESEHIPKKEGLNKANPNKRSSQFPNRSLKSGLNKGIFSRTPILIAIPIGKLAGKLEIFAHTHNFQWRYCQCVCREFSGQLKF